MIKYAALILLDLSATFDTVDHTIIVDCLALWYGIGLSSVALSWFISAIVFLHHFIFRVVFPTNYLQSAYYLL